MTNWTDTTLSCRADAHRTVMSLTERAHPLIAARVNTEVERQAEVDREQANADRIAAIEETLARLFGEGGPGRGNTTEDGAE